MVHARLIRRLSQASGPIAIVVFLAARRADSLFNLADKSVVTSLTASLVSVAKLKEEESQADSLLALLGVRRISCSQYRGAG